MNELNSGPGLRYYASKDEYLAKRGVSALKTAVKADEAQKVAVAAQDVGEGAKQAVEKGAHKVDISKEAKRGAKKIEKSIKSDVKELGKAGAHLAKDAAVSIAKALPSISDTLPIVDLSTKEKIKSGDVKEIKELAPVNRPGIFFIEGLHLASLSSDAGGVGDLAEAVKGGELYGWRDEDKIFEEILKRPHNQPIILVGHSLGGDTAVNIANRLNSLKGGFRKVNLLVTMDSVGFGNDIIPQNVKKNLNFISDNDYFFNDGPNIARNAKLTDVENFLRTEEHTDIDESQDVHFEIVTNIKDVISDQKQDNRFQKLTSLFESIAKSVKE
jgi:hypothetical protein